MKITGKTRLAFLAVRIIDKDETVSDEEIGRRVTTIILSRRLATEVKEEKPVKKPKESPENKAEKSAENKADDPNGFAGRKKPLDMKD